MCSAIAIGSVICIVSAIAGDTSQDLKTGYLLGATPKKQQIGEIVGVIAAALAIGGTLYLLDSAWGFGTCLLYTSEYVHAGEKRRLQNLEPSFSICRGGCFCR